MRKLIANVMCSLDCLTTFRCTIMQEPTLVQRPSQQAVSPTAKVS